MSRGLAPHLSVGAEVRAQVWLWVWVPAAGGNQRHWGDMDESGMGPRPTRLPRGSWDGAHADCQSLQTLRPFLPPALLPSKVTCNAVIHPPPPPLPCSTLCQTLPPMLSAWPQLPPPPCQPTALWGCQRPSGSSPAPAPAARLPGQGSLTPPSTGPHPGRDVPHGLGVHTAGRFVLGPPSASSSAFPGSPRLWDVYGCLRNAQVCEVHWASQPVSYVVACRGTTRTPPTHSHCRS